MSALRKLVLDEKVVEHQRDIEKIDADIAARDALIVELGESITELERLRLQAQQEQKAKEKVVINAQIENMRQLKQQCDDAECAECLAELERLGIIGEGKYVLLDAYRCKLICDTKALQVSDAAKKALIEMRWK